MCEECRHYPCISRCPNFEEDPVCYCSECGEGIFNGDIYYKIADMMLCEDCINDCKTYAEFEEPDPDCWELTDRLYEESKYEDDEE